MKLFQKIGTVLWCVFLGAAVPCAAQDETAALTGIAEDIRGKAVRIREYQGTDLGDLSLKSSIDFDDRHPVLMAQYETDGSVKTETRYSYLENGALSEITGTGSSGDLKWKYEYRYDEEGRLSEEVSSGSGGAAEWKACFVYNDQHLAAEKTTYKSDGTVSLRETYGYTEDRRLSVYEALYPDGKLLKRTEFSYDTSGNLVSETRYDGNGLYEQVEYSYTEEGRLSRRKTLDARSTVKTSLERAYGENGTVIGERLFSGDSGEAEISYIYDGQGNWVRRRERGPVYTLREITYGE
ncbi:hypothetical protein [Breznakiella homolactica]|uniref:YD repeat-containing protein n=1 Tax=Breznakiella homolactica TaxID=2798577 RepID=A0A7T7XLQ4_9SPIR|nr:hypothetical protein [Breznakiella homolactica]QQO08729.1 hypothetical protein JFL75_17650 [Breznakiella homolactica]